MTSTRGPLDRLADLAMWLPLRGLVGTLARLPVDRALDAGAAFGRQYARRGGPRTDVARTNLEIAFPGWSASQREEVLEASFANLGRCIAEVAQLHGPGRETLVRRVRVEGDEHYRAARARSKSGGVLILSAHFGSWELLGAAMIHLGYPLSVVHHALENPRLDAMATGWRRAAGLETLEIGRAGLQIFRALAQGRLVAVLLDQNAGRDEGVFAPFFSRLASTRAGPARIAMAREIPVVPAFFFREEDGVGHVARAYPALEIEPEGDDPEAALQRNVARMNRAIEVAIEQAPDHWLWVHKRWKTRPESDPARIYPRRHRRAA